MGSMDGRLPPAGEWTVRKKHHHVCLSSKTFKWSPDGVQLPDVAANDKQIHFPQMPKCWLLSQPEEMCKNEPTGTLEHIKTNY